MQQALREAARRSNSTLLGELCHPFEPQGITALALLGESHISIHTWPEAGYAAVDVFTCGRHTRPEAACEYLIQVFQARRYSLRKLPRRTTDAAPIEEMADFPEALSCETAGRRR